RLGDVLILGGWIGALAAVLLHDERFDVDRVTSVDIDPSCETIAASLNATHARAGRFVARTADMLALDYLEEAKADLVINTSCEHLSEFDRWYARIPAGQLLVMQSNDYFACDEHVNCVPDLATFKAQAPLRELLFEGERSMRRYVRFMLIGRK
ncbi:MAG TPA: class I SAM-dependent methyltransferase, partial [Casimicrobiaceae bacterium]|nr:class I SAM-dependent methyltransferase [Casimicrobiaceae bacterium]